MLSAFQVKELNFWGSISKGFLKHQIRREKVIWEVENNNPNTFSLEKRSRGYINAAVRVWSGENVRDSVTFFIDDAIQTYIFFSDHFQTSYVSPTSWDEESYWCLVTESKVKVTFCTLPVKHCGYDTDFSFVSNHFETAQIGSLWH